MNLSYELITLKQIAVFAILTAEDHDISDSGTAHAREARSTEVP